MKQYSVPSVAKRRAGADVGQPVRVQSKVQGSNKASSSLALHTSSIACVPFGYFCS